MGNGLTVFVISSLVLPVLHVYVFIFMFCLFFPTVCLLIKPTKYLSTVYNMQICDKTNKVT